MGLTRSLLDYIEERAEDAIGGVAGKRMLELGDQVIGKSEPVSESTGKEYFENRGVLHTSFDLNGRHGAIRVDLSKPIRDRQWLGAFDIVTNSGTTEHVEPFRSQYECFLNIHNCLRQGGIAVHMVPDVDELEKRGLCRNHCEFYYSHKFFGQLADLNGYGLLDSRVIDGLRCVSLQKNSDNSFTRDRDAILDAISLRRFGTFIRLLHQTRPLRQHLGLTLTTFRRLSTFGRDSST